jgi:hypothetical protein
MKDTTGFPLKVEVETIQPSVRFSDARRELASEGRRFTSKALRRIRYPELHLCCIGSARSAACSPSLVRSEKERRIGRFLSLAPEELGQAERWLRAEGMLEDVAEEMSSRSAPSWDCLRPRQRLAFKLICIYNHVDSPEERILEAVGLLKESAGDGIPAGTCSSLCSALVSLARRHAGTQEDGEGERMGDPEFRGGIWKAMEEVLDLLPREEQAVVLREQVRDYRCTSDCFRPVAF